MDLVNELFIAKTTLKFMKKILKSFPNANLKTDLKEEQKESKNASLSSKSKYEIISLK